MTQRKIYIITWAQAHTPVHDKFWKSLTTYAEHRKADLYVIPSHGAHGDYDKKVAPNLLFTNKPLVSHGKTGVVALGALRVRSTRVRPLQGLAGVGRGMSCVIGHPKWHLECHTVVSANYPQILQTTGACTVANYQESAAGFQAEFHHMIGAAIVEQVGEFYHIRRVCGDRTSGAFTDIGTRVNGKRITQAPPAIALMVGDSHAEEACPVAVQATREMVKVLKPKRVLVNDVFSLSGVSHHLRGKTFTRIQLQQAGHASVDLMLKQTSELMSAIGATDVLRSNHHDHLDQWLDNPDGAEDATNARTWHYLNYLRLAHGTFAVDAISREHPEVFNNATIHPECGTCKLSSDTVAVHGHLGANGAKGLKNYGNKLGIKIISAHTHVPFGLGGHNVVGHTSQARHGYTNPNFSSWLQGNGVLHADNKFQHLHIIKDAPKKYVWRG